MIAGSRLTPLVANSAAPPVAAANLLGEPVVVPSGRWTLLSFLRYATCPACNLRVRELRQGGDSLRAAGVEWFAVFHSPEWRLKQHMPKDSWPQVISDPDGVLGHTYRTRRSWLGMGLSMLVPSFYWAYLKTLAFGYWGGAVDRWIHVMPADFL